MNNDAFVSISQAYYDELIITATKMSVIKDIAIRDKGAYGYTPETSRTIDLVLGIERKAEE